MTRSVAPALTTGLLAPKQARASEADAAGGEAEGKMFARTLAGTAARHRASAAESNAVSEGQDTNSDEHAAMHSRMGAHRWKGSITDERLLDKGRDERAEADLADGSGKTAASTSDVFDQIAAMTLAAPSQSTDPHEKGADAEMVDVSKADTAKISSSAGAERAAIAAAADQAENVVEKFPMAKVTRQETHFAPVRHSASEPADTAGAIAAPVSDGREFSRNIEAQATATPLASRPNLGADQRPISSAARSRPGFAATADGTSGTGASFENVARSNLSTMAPGATPAPQSNDAASFGAGSGKFDDSHDGRGGVARRANGLRDGASSPMRQAMARRDAADADPRQPAAAVTSGGNAALQSGSTPTVGPSQAGVQVLNAIIDNLSPAAAGEQHLSSSGAQLNDDSLQPQLMRTIKLQLEPASLGLVNVVLQKSQAALMVRLETERADTAGQLEQDRSALTDRLAANGYDVGQLLITRATPASSETVMQGDATQARTLNNGSAGSGEMQNGSHSSERNQSGSDGSAGHAPVPPPSPEEGGASRNAIAGERFLGLRSLRSV